MLEREIQESIEKLKTRKVTRPDDIAGAVLKNLAVA